MTDNWMDDPFEAHEIDHEYLHLPEDCKHEHAIGVQDSDGTYFTRCLDCGSEW